MLNANKGICSEGIRKGKRVENVRYREKRTKNIVIHRIFFLFQEELKKMNDIDEIMIDNFKNIKINKTSD